MAKNKPIKIRKTSEIIDDIVLFHKIEPIKAIKVRTYLESIAYQLNEKNPQLKDEAIRPYLIKIAQIASSYPDPSIALKLLDSATELYLKHNNF